MYIDAFTHIIPKKYLEALQKKVNAGKIASKYVDGIGAIPPIANVFERLRVMEGFPDIQQVLTLSGPQLESIAQPEDAVELAKICNDELAEIVQKYPEKFVAAGGQAFQEEAAAIFSLVIQENVRVLNARVELERTLQDGVQDGAQFQPRGQAKAGLAQLLLRIR